MTLTTIHRGIEFVGSEKDIVALRAWYENLGDGDVKASVAKIKCREFRPYEQANFRVIVLCKHPFLDQTREIESANRSCDDVRANRALSALVNVFSKWIESNGLPEEILLGERHAFVDWLPSEMSQFVTIDLSPQGQAQLEMNHHILDCLDLIRLATSSSAEFLSLWEGSNEPFFAAGRIIYGTFQWIREVPQSFFQDGPQSELLLERVGQFTREYLGLLRLALLAGAESPLLDRVAFVLRRFKFQYAVEIPGWRVLADELLDGSADVPIHTPITKPPQYGEIDDVSDRLRQNLVDATKGMEDEIPVLINALLPTLPVPQSAELFTGEIET
jgi:hypothetical protein